MWSPSLQMLNSAKLAGRGEHGRDAAFHLADLGGHGVVRGVLQARVEVTAFGKVEESAHLLARGVFERRRLDDRRRARFAVARLVAALHADGVNMFAHGFVSSTVGRPCAGGVDACVWYYTTHRHAAGVHVRIVRRVSPPRCCSGRRARAARRCRRRRSSYTMARFARPSSARRVPRRSTGWRSCW